MAQMPYYEMIGGELFRKLQKSLGGGGQVALFGPHGGGTSLVVRELWQAALRRPRRSARMWCSSHGTAAKASAAGLPRGGKPRKLDPGLHRTESR